MRKEEIERLATALDGKSQEVAKKEAAVQLLEQGQSAYQLLLGETQNFYKQALDDLMGRDQQILQ